MKTHKIQAVAKGSIAEELEIAAGDMLADIDGREVEDILDYRYKTAGTYVELGIRTAEGEYYIAEVEKDEGEDIGLSFDGLMSAKRGCANSCTFCFVDQLPNGVRPSLCFKDDDWRLSFLTGNYITLTNVSDAEMKRICEQRISPLYISVHTMNMPLRREILRNQRAENLTGRLQTLHDAGIGFHSQIVLMPDVNDGEELRYTIEELHKLAPAAIDCAIVPIGLTAHREGLHPLQAFNAQSAADVIDLVDGLNAAFISGGGSNFAYCADEFYVMAGRDLPPYEYYGDFGQIEDGVGMLRHFLHGFEGALQHAQKRGHYRATLATGAAAYGFMQGIAGQAAQALGIDIDVVKVENGFFGGRVSVSGLLTGGDYYNTLSSHGGLGDVLLICRSSLRDEGDMFLDDMPLGILQEKLGVNILCMPNDGAEFLNILERWGT